MQCILLSSLPDTKCLRKRREKKRQLQKDATLEWLEAETQSLDISMLKAAAARLNRQRDEQQNTPTCRMSNLRRRGPQK
jgi:hypothetical protein